ncbi:hypothetical protein KQ302_04175 [Synechococcus sp. CS-602]|nr:MULTISPECIES: hypothetical protein [Synechococcaceae]APD47526.1 hypothetical protein BM449_03540 [Synechococcus sp. SynAce01]MCT0202507.1 hypothetical protein [Synechococcus sp. CS-603]MCT0247153.1 hypothetical protein [Synechococcus sp. CS-601]MCT4365441.1 hypothetical protein [Candidatus Regnicoccus frigidus MAG-AL1]TWB96447.1 hypothetical protein FB106_101111 [Synechococcus sp. Ace-Pa]
MAAGVLVGLQPAPAPGDAAEFRDCGALRAEYQHLFAEAISAEVELLSATRRRLCPDLEPPREGGANLRGPDQELDIGGLLACRQQAERAVQAASPLLFTAQGGFRFFTPSGASQARAAQRLLAQLEQQGCSRDSF